MENIRNLQNQELEAIVEKYGEKKFRAKQISEWLWKKGVASFSEMKNISENLIEKLQSDFFIDKLQIDFKVSSIDKTTKVLFRTYDDLQFEGVIIPAADRVTACISTQMGCPLACKFCATGTLGFTRNLSVGEIFDEVFLLNILTNDIFNSNLSNIVVMGMGEPLLNYENTLSAINILCSKQSFNLSPSRITLSTSGIAPKIKQLADDKIKFELAISLHSADNDKRNILMPINNKYDLEQLKEALIYFHKNTGTRITYEYLLLDGVNDSLEDARKLTEFTKISPCKINIIEYNFTNDADYKKSKNLSTFKEFLESKNLIVTVRKSKGQDIAAACGQLAKVHIDKK